MRTLAATTSLITLVILAAPAQAQEAGFFLDDEAALVAGAVGATTRGSGAAWYNPAGLGALTGSSLDLNASVYGLRHYAIDGFLQTRVTGSETVSEDVSFTSILAIPSVLTFARALDDGLGIALGVYVRDGEDIDLRARTSAEAVNSATGLPQPASWSIYLAEQSTESYFGLALGWEAAESVRIGASLFGVYNASQFALGQSLELGAIGPVQNGDLTVDVFEIGTTRDIGLTGSIGLQVDVAPVELGLLIRAPVLGVLQWNDVAGNTNISVTDETTTHRDTERVDEDTMVWGASQLFPGSAEVSASLTLGEHRLSASLDLTLPGEASGEPARDLVVNGRIGGLFRVAEDWTIGTGLYTDLSAHRRVDELGADTAVNWFGATFGVAKDTRFLLDALDPSEADELVFTTTLGLRYGLGVGQVGGLLFDTTESASDSSVPALDVVFHEASVHVGSAVRF